jgi:AcrR family transcriptional regulator
MTKIDRRVQRTRELLQKALIELISEHGYDAITIQDIVERANVGRTTFYLHYSSKDDLFMSCHEAIVSQFHFGPLYPHPLSREELLAPEAPAGMIRAYLFLEM